MSEWNLEALQKLISDRVEESLTLEYKGAGALGEVDRDKAEITKDVSAMANSAGGTIIYGMAESGHLPSKIDPIKRGSWSKERLDQVVQTIQPKIDGLTIHPVPVGDDDEVIYVVEVPQSTTAHQARDKRYYKRYNFIAQAMEDYEIRDVMNRGQNPRIELFFKIESKDTLSIPLNKNVKSYHLIVSGRNSGNRYASYINGYIVLPTEMLTAGEKSKHEQIHDKGMNNSRVHLINFVKEREGYVPLLPSLSYLFSILQLQPDYWDFRESYIKWKVYADNALPNEGATRINTITIDGRQY